MVESNLAQRPSWQDRSVRSIDFLQFELAPGTREKPREGRVGFGGSRVGVGRFGCGLWALQCKWQVRVPT